MEERFLLSDWLQIRTVPFCHESSANKEDVRTKTKNFDFFLFNVQVCIYSICLGITSLQDREVIKDTIRTTVTPLIISSVTNVTSLVIILSTAAWTRWIYDFFHKKLVSVSLRLVLQPIERAKSIRPATGIPRSHMVQVNKDAKGAMLTPDGQYVVPFIDKYVFASFS